SQRSGTRIEAPKTDAGQVLHMNPAPSSWLERQARRSRAVYTAGHAVKSLMHRGEGKPGSSMELDLLESRDSAALEKAWQSVTTQLEDLKMAATDFHFSAGIVVLPPREQVFGLYPNSDYQKRLRRLADQLGLFVIDPLPSLVTSSLQKPSLFIPYDRNHPSPAGHSLIAQSIVTYFDGHEDVVPVVKQLAQSQRAQ